MIPHSNDDRKVASKSSSSNSSSFTTDGGSSGGVSNNKLAATNGNGNGSSAKGNKGKGNGNKGNVKGSKGNNHEPWGGDGEELMVKELNAMSLQERERTYEELHGVVTTKDADGNTTTGGTVVSETPSLIVDKLREMQQHLSNYQQQQQQQQQHQQHQQQNQQSAYEMALGQSRSYVENEDFRLAFLRAESFDAKLATERFVKFFEGKLHYFGPDKLTKTITLDDLDSDAQKVIKSGHFQFLTQRDRAGRVVLFDASAMEYPFYGGATVKSIARVFYYILMCQAEDVENQKNGIVTMLYKIETPPGIPKHPVEVSFECPRILQWVPLRVVGNHMCLDDTTMKVVVRTLLFSAGKEFRTRFRLHDGTHTEVMYALMTFGIPVDSFPITSDGAVKKTASVKWFAKRRAKDTAIEAGRQFDGVDAPTARDVLFGKGKSIQTHTGNVHLRELVDEHWEAYSAAKKGHKGEVVQRVIDAIKRSSTGRFLSKDARTGWWVEVSDQEVTKKVTKTFLSAGTSKAAASANKRHRQQPITLDNVSVFHTTSSEKRRRIGDDVGNNDGDNGLLLAGGGGGSGPIGKDESQEQSSSSCCIPSTNLMFFL
mmetsp:Transcript_54327/g.131854  ORF Transcript_54327/g.131854 Transcript_54327/m.131854 type:complete len:598 (-) Transcript_54327:64-1857(-)